MYGGEGYKYMTCPYDPNHIIRSFRFPYHIYKCKKNHPDVELANCVYNFSHFIKPEHFFEHIESCPNRSRSDSNGDILLKHDSCKNEYSGNEEEELDAFEEPFCHLKPLERRFVGSARNFALQGKTVDSEVGSRSSHVGLYQPDDLPPLQLPKTTSKAFQIKKSNTRDSASRSSGRDTSGSSISKYFADNSSCFSGDENNILRQIENYKIDSEKPKH